MPGWSSSLGALDYDRVAGEQLVLQIAAPQPTVTLCTDQSRCPLRGVDAQFVGIDMVLERNNRLHFESVLELAEYGAESATSRSCRAGVPWGRAGCCEERRDAVTASASGSGSRLSTY